MMKAFQVSASDYGSRAINHLRSLDASDARKVALIAGMFLLAVPAHAAAAGGASDITSFFQNLVNIITGTTGQVICVLLVAFLGVGIATQSVRPSQAGIVVVGIAVVFSAAWIVQQITA